MLPASTSVSASLLFTDRSDTREDRRETGFEIAKKNNTRVTPMKKKEAEPRQVE